MEAYSGQRHASGEDYVSHTVEVATILATVRLDSAIHHRGVIHDTVEDTALSASDVEARFGAEVSTIVDGVTQLGRVQFSSATEQQVENYRKMLLSMAEDSRVILVKLAGRLPKHANPGTGIPTVSWTARSHCVKPARRLRD
jgi:GTP diphosphokinase / guanosine-3',5'-bis(diphosphate) 3'-diphosphatase